MALTDIGELPPRGRVLIDSAPIIYGARTRWIWSSA